MESKKTHKQKRKIVVKKRPEELDKFITRVKAGIAFREAQEAARARQDAAEAAAVPSPPPDVLPVADVPDHVIALIEAVQPEAEIVVPEPEEPEKKSWLDRLEAWLGAE